MHVSIGVLAYNEADSIGKTLHSLFQQSIFQTDKLAQSIEVIVVPNGCHDRTAEISHTTLETLTATVAHPNVQYQVCEVDRPGKANAWNCYVHGFANPAADYLILMDADIEFLELETLDSLVQTLEQNSTAWVSVDRHIKDITFKQKKNPIEKLSLMASQVSGAKSVWICGQLYCGRASILRQIWMPIGILVEDGYLLKMIVTHDLTAPEFSERVVRASSASHVFEAYTNMTQWLRHEQRQVVGNTINTYLYTELEREDQTPFSQLVKLQNVENPLWLNTLVQETVKRKGWWAIPGWLLVRRFGGIRHRPIHKTLILLPFSIAACLVDIALCIQANRELHQWGVAINDRSVES